MRSKITALLLLAAATFTASCNKAPKDKRIAFIPKGRAHAFWQSVHAGAVKAQQENAGFTILWNGPASETDYEGQIKIMDSAINQKVDAICLAPIDKKILVTLVQNATSAGIPRPIAQKLNEALIQAIRSPEIRERMSAAGFEQWTSTPEEFAKVIKTDRDRWGPIVKASGAIVD